VNAHRVRITVTPLAVCSSRIQIWDCNGHTNQQWWGGGSYQFKSSVDGNKCIDLYDGDTTNGKPLGAYFRRSYFL
jgi:hypothetical protein